MSDIKQVIVMRKKFNFPDGTSRKLRTGKMAAQACHASMKVILDMMEREHHSQSIRLTLNIVDESPLDKWINGIFTKVCVYVDSEEELDLLYAKAQELNLPCAMIVDAGKTEFNGVPTKTCIAVGPASSEDVDKITGHLKLL